MPKKFPELLKDAREQKSLSQSELAELAGLQPSAISHFETGRRAPSFDNLKKLADSLSVSIDSLLGRTTDTAGSGPVVQKIFRHVSNMSADEQDTLARFAEMLAKKSHEKKKSE